MTEPNAALDDLIARLRARAADPEARVDVFESEFFASVRSLDLGGLLTMGRSVMGDLTKVLGQIRETGKVTPEMSARAEGFQRRMETPVVPDLPPPASRDALERAEADVGAPLPAALRRSWAEVADGGFGPGSGLLPLGKAMATYHDFRRESPGPRRSTWPPGLLPIGFVDPGYTCVDVATGRVLAWDPEDLTEYGGQAQWAASFTEIAPSVEAWLATWVGTPTPAERAARKAAAEAARATARAEAERTREVSPMEIEQARKARAAIAAMTPAQRNAMGLPEVGWERVVWGGIGLEDDDGDDPT